MPNPTHIVVFPQLKLQLDGLLQAFKPPLSLLWLEGRNPQKLGDGILRVAELQLLCVVVFVLDVDIARLLFIVLFVFKVISARRQRSRESISSSTGTDCSSSDSCMKSSSSDIAVRWYDDTLETYG